MAIDTNIAQICSRENSPICYFCFPLFGSWPAWRLLIVTCIRRSNTFLSRSLQIKYSIGGQPRFLLFFRANGSRSRGCIFWSSEAMEKITMESGRFKVPLYQEHIGKNLSLRFQKLPRIPNSKPILSKETKRIINIVRTKSLKNSKNKNIPAYAKTYCFL